MQAHIDQLVHSERQCISSGQFNVDFSLIEERMADRRLSERLGNDFEGKKKKSWKKVKQVRKGKQARDEMVKDVNGQILCDGIEVRRRWAEYFEQVLNVADVREANINEHSLQLADAGVGRFE